MTGGCLRYKSYKNDAMKKLVIIVFVSTLSIEGNAQLEMDSVGRIAFSPDQSVQTGYSATMQALEEGGLLIKRDFEFNKCTDYGLTVDIKGKNSYAAGLLSSTSSISSDTNVYGTRSVATGGYQALGIYGGISNANYNGAGIYGSTLPIPYSTSDLSGIYAGYFKGMVKTTGLIYGTLVSPSSVSSPSNESGETIIVPVSDERANSVTNKIQQIDILQMERINQDGSLPANKGVEDVGENEAPIQTKLSAVSYGLAADQLQKVYPELVYEDAEGNYSINYIEMVPLLVQSIKELSAKVTSLRQRVSEGKNTLQ